jgi:hypothetical protein
MCREYKNITFRNCDILRGGNTACDIQNGDCAEVHHITFENIRLELEHFYTPSVLQRSEKDNYNLCGDTEISAIVCIGNPRFRDMDMYSFMKEKFLDVGVKKGDRQYASVHDIFVKDVYIYADGEILSKNGAKCVRVYVDNIIEGTEFKNICVENVVLNEKRLQSSEMEIHTTGFDEKEFSIK